MTTEKHTFKPSLSLLDATMVVSGGMIGSGIFIVSADITRNTGSAGWLILVWIITGFMTITAALSYGEQRDVSQSRRSIYIPERSMGELPAFIRLEFFAVIQTATIAAVGVAFANSPHILRRCLAKILQCWISGS